MIKKYQKLLRIIFFISIISVYILCILPVNNISPVQFEGLDKVVHACIFLYLSVLLFLCKFTSSKHFYQFFFLFLFGVIIELTQYFLPWRSFEILDIIFDTLGILLGIILNFWFERKLSV